MLFLSKINSRNALDLDLPINPGVLGSFLKSICPIIYRIVSKNSIPIFLKKMDRIAKTIVCTSPDCGSPGVVEDLDIHDSHKEK
jgi:hypothetical protein